MLMSQISDAEIAGDADTTRSLVSVLQNRVLLPAKVLIFEEDLRPGYFGTWTRNHSKIISLRRPFARDVIALDYNYDSASEWEDEGDADDVGGEDIDIDDEDGNGEELDSDADSWLVDDDHDEEGRSSSPDLLFLSLPTKRKPTNVDDDGQSKAKKRKTVVPLVPVVKGPCWEASIGECPYEPFSSYRIQLFNGESIS